jgi:hypothetical protein
MPTSMVSVKLMGLNDVQAELRDIHGNQLPFANMLALTLTAKSAQSFVQDTLLPARFTLRRAAWMKRNIKVTSATKKVLEATVEDTFDAMALQDTAAISLLLLAAARSLSRSLELVRAICL